MTKTNRSSVCSSDCDTNQKRGVAVANIMPENERKALHWKVLHAAARLFLAQGYSQTSTRQIALKAGIHISTMNRAYGSKENILREMVGFVLEGQFTVAQRLVEGKTDDPVFFYAAETVLQLYMAESSEAVRDLYASAYSMPHSSELIHSTIAGKLESIFRRYLPNADAKEFYELEIASGGIIRGFMTVKCDLYFTIERKVKRFLESSLRIYRVPEEKIAAAIAFTQQFDYPAIARGAINGMLDQLESGYTPSLTSSQ